MSTYPVDVKAVQKSTAATHTIFAGPGRIVGLYINKEPNLAQSTVTLKDDSTTVAEFTVRATNNTNGAGITEYIQFPGTGIRCATSIKLTIAEHSYILYSNIWLGEFNGYNYLYSHCSKWHDTIWNR